MSRKLFWLSAVFACALLLMPSAAQARPRHNAKAHTTAKHGRLRRGAWKRHGQQHIDEDRAREIQQALIREKYLDGEPSGVWDEHTKEAMSRYQDDHGWQTKTLPDARALIALGLGPRHDNLINPEDAAPPTAPATTVSGRPMQLVENHQ